jgi:hypothetical protein
VGTYSGAGGSGLVVIRHSDADLTATYSAGVSFTEAGGYKIYEFTGSGETIEWVS